MSTLKLTLKNGENFEFVENTFQHQIGNGAVQIMFKDGSQKIFNDFAYVEVVPSDEEREDFEKQIAAQEARAKEAIAAMEAEEEAQVDLEAQTPANDSEAVVDATH